MNRDSCYQTLSSNGIARITLNRPEAHNALDRETTGHLIRMLQQLDQQPQVRVVVIQSSSQHFCAGADLHWLGATGTPTQHDAGNQLAELMWRLHTLSKPTVALIQGAAYGGGVGLVACCDLALSSRNSRFCFSEVRLGLIPAVISPYLIKALGERTTRRYCLTAEPFDAEQACRIGLVHEVVDVEQLPERLQTLIEALLAGGPTALTQTKHLLDLVATMDLDETLPTRTARWTSEISRSTEAQEGIDAFLDKRQPNWLNSRR